MKLSNNLISIKERGTKMENTTNVITNDNQLVCDSEPSFIDKVKDDPCSYGIAAGIGAGAVILGGTIWHFGKKLVVKIKDTIAEKEEDEQLVVEAEEVKEVKEEKKENKEPSLMDMFKNLSEDEKKALKEMLA